MLADVQRFTARSAGTDATTNSFSDWWPRLTQEFRGLSLSADESQRPQQSEDQPQHTEPQERERGEQRDEPSPQAPSEYPACPKADPAVLWMDRVAAALRVVKEAVVLTMVLLPWILGIRPSEATAEVVTQLDSAAAG